MLLGEDENANSFYLLNDMIYRVPNITTNNNIKNIVEYKPLEEIITNKKKLERKIEEYNKNGIFNVVLSKTTDQIIAWYEGDFGSIMLEELVKDIEYILNKCGFIIDEEQMGGNYLISTFIDDVYYRIKACVKINFKLL